MPAKGDGRVPGTDELPGTPADAPDGHARNSSVRESGAARTTVAAAPIPRPRHTLAGDAIATPAAPRATTAPARTAGEAAPLKVLVIEDDAAGARLIKSAAADSGTAIEVHWARGLDHAIDLLSAAPSWTRRSRPRSTDFGCVLLDLAEPGAGAITAGGAEPGSTAAAAAPADAGSDSDGLARLRELLQRAPQTAVVVLTDAGGAELGAAAVAAGAQDFLIKHETNGPLLARALRYAVERKRADESQRRLVEAELRGQENARLQRHLLPTPLLDGAGLSFTRRYRPGRRRALLGGDFYDAVRTDDGTVHVVIGDVCGHGPDEAALGVALRIAWRTLVFAGLTGETLLMTLQHVLEHERRSDEIFATLCMLVIEPDGTNPDAGRPDASRPDEGEPGVPAVEHARLYLAGHPAPLLLGAGHGPVLLPAELAGPALGLLPCDDSQANWPPQRLELRPDWRLLLYTDGLIEGRVGAGSRRLGQDGLADLIGDHQAAGLTRGRLVDSAIAEVEDLNGGALTDDVAVLLLERNPAPLILG